jgi:hypothetical protein
MKIIYLPSVLGLISTGTIASHRVNEEFAPLSGEALTDLHIGILDIFIKAGCNWKVQDARAVWEKTDASSKEEILNVATNFAPQDEATKQRICKLLESIINGDG